VDLLYSSREWRRNLHLRLVRLDLEKGGVLSDHVTFLDQDIANLGLDQALARSGRTKVRGMRA
jgi:hypothetical protein